MKRNIHTTLEEIRTQNSDSTVSAIKENSRKVEENTRAVMDKSVETIGFTGVVNSLKTNTNAIDDLHESINTPVGVVNKLEQIKSASLITNQELKKIAKKELPLKMKVEIEGAEVVTIRGAKGDKGDKGDQGRKGEKGEKGEQGLQGVQGEKGEKGEQGVAGKDGVNGKDGRDGINGKDGLNGSPDSSEDIVDKINKAKKRIYPKQIIGLEELIQDSNTRLNNPVGRDTGGGIKYQFRSNGTVISDHVTELNFTTGITATYSGNGRITLSASGGSGSGYQAPLTGSVNGVNDTFTWTDEPNVLVVDGVPRQKTQSDGTVNWTGTTTTVLAVVPNFDLFASA